MWLLQQPGTLLALPVSVSTRSQISVDIQTSYPMHVPTLMDFVELLSSTSI